MSHAELSLAAERAYPGTDTPLSFMLEILRGKIPSIEAWLIDFVLSSDRNLFNTPLPEVLPIEPSLCILDNLPTGERFLGLFGDPAPVDDQHSVCIISEREKIRQIIDAIDAKDDSSASCFL
jgi:hypothetical protein